MKLMNTEIKTGTDNYSTASFIRRQLNTLEGANWKLKEVKQTLADLGLEVTTQRLVDENGKESKVNNVYNIQLVGADSQYTSVNHREKRLHKKANNSHYQTVEGYIYKIKFLRTTATSSSLAIYLINEDGEKVCFSSTTATKQNEDGETYKTQVGLNHYWLNKAVQQDFIYDRAKKNLPVLGLHMRLTVRISNNYANVEHSHLLEWDETSQAILESAKNSGDIEEFDPTPLINMTYLPESTLKINKNFQLEDNTRYTFTATFVNACFQQYQQDNGTQRRVAQLHLRDLSVNGEGVMFDTCINYTGSFKKLGELLPGDLLQFEATVDVTYQYVTGLHNSPTYTLNHPTKATMINTPLFTRNTVPSDDYALVGYATLSTLSVYDKERDYLDNLYIQDWEDWQAESDYKYLTDEQLEADLNFKLAYLTNDVVAG